MSAVTHRTFSTADDIFSTADMAWGGARRGWGLVVSFSKRREYKSTPTKDSLAVRQLEQA